MTPEGKVKKECRAYLRSIGAYVFSPVQMGYGQQGVDDFVCYKGRFVAVEYKRGDGVRTEPTARQQQCLNAVSEAGGVGLVTRSRGQLEDQFRMIFG